MARQPAHRRRPVLPKLENVLALWWSESQAAPIRAELPLRNMRSATRAHSSVTVQRGCTPATNPATNPGGPNPMADSSFDVVSKVDHQEVDNALNQAAKELATRFDFRGTETKIAWKGDETIEITSSTEERAKAAVDVFKEKLI